MAKSKSQSCGSQPAFQIYHAGISESIFYSECSQYKKGVQTDDWIHEGWNQYHYSLVIRYLEIFAELTPTAPRCQAVGLPAQSMR